MTKRALAIAAVAALFLYPPATLAEPPSGQTATPSQAVPAASGPADQTAEAAKLCREKNLAGSAYDECVKLELAKRKVVEPELNARTAGPKSK